MTMETSTSVPGTAGAPATPEKPEGGREVSRGGHAAGLAGPKRRRQRAPGKRTVKSCAACRVAHVRCVADRYGVPCERCEKKAWTDCTLMQTPPKYVSANRVSGAAAIHVDGEGSGDTDIDPFSPQGRMLRQMASDGLVLVVRKRKRASPCPAS
ncbi:hypothetical protein F5Y17DRAFT_287259 [Xylariaceae sp. FL0594]|nr:hypothetical protein F5Y17DRAFT_287259 [Xylariaceae sp. FL0594]